MPLVASRFIAMFDFYVIMKGINACTYRSAAQIPDPLELSFWVCAREAGCETLEVLFVLKEKDLNVVHYKGEIGQDGVGMLFVVGHDATDLLLEGEG